MATESYRGTGKWGQPGVPHKGWSCVDVEDLGEPSAICEMCETQEIRFVHYMSHPDYSSELGCGCVCAEHMEQDYFAARRREAALRSFAARRGRWLSRHWKISHKGNSYLNVDGYNIVVYPRGLRTSASDWGFRVRNPRTNDTLEARRRYPTEDAAKLRSFDAMIWMQERGR